MPREGSVLARRKAEAAAAAAAAASTDSGDTQTAKQKKRDKPEGGTKVEKKQKKVPIVEAAEESRAEQSTERYEEGLNDGGVAGGEDKQPSLDAKWEKERNAQATGRRIFVGGLSTETTEGEIRDLFQECGEIAGFHRPVDEWGGSKRFAFLTFNDAAAVEKACQYNDTEAFGEWIRVQVSEDKKAVNPGNAHFKPGTKRDGCSEVFVGNLPWDVDENMLWETFGAVGTVSQVRLVRDKQTDALKGFGFVQLDSDSAAEKAVATLNGQLLNGRPMRIDFQGNKTVIDEKAPSAWDSGDAPCGKKVVF